MPRSLVLFDLDNTLVDRQGILEDWATEFTSRHGLADEEQAHVLAAVSERTYPSTFETIRARYQLPASTAELWEAYCADIAALVTCPAEILHGLDELRAAGWRVGVATNGAVDIQYAKLRTTGIVEHVDGIFVSEEADARKPQREHFAMAAARCGAILGDGGWMVGDNPVTDIAGGASAGLATIWVSHGRPWPSDLRPAPDDTVPNARAAIDLLLHADDHTRTPT